jgi:hypothetical protein
MSDKHNNNISILKEFVSTNQIKKYSVSFPCGVEIETAKNEVSIECKARITFDEFDDNGILYLIKDNLDPYLYPTEFKAKFCNMDIEYGILLITDTHTRNPDIGEYKVTITAYNKVV